LSIESRFRETIARHQMIRPGERVLAAVSGGPDSTALLSLLCGAAIDLKLEIHVAHLDHGWRGRESARDAEFVRRLAMRHGAPVTVGHVDPKVRKRAASGAVGRRQSSLEARARSVRTRFLRETAAAIGASRIALGHTRDDQAESLLLRLLRGSGRLGLAGTYPVVDGLFIRPLIDLRRKDVLAHLKRRHLGYRIDSTNRDPGLTRNRIRRRLIPRLAKEFNPEVVEALARAADTLRDEEAYLAGLAEEAFTRLARPVPSGSGVDFPLPGLEDLPKALLRRVIRLACARTRGRLHGITSAHVRQVVEILERRGGAVHLPDGLRAVARSGVLRFGPVDPASAGPASVGATQGEASGEAPIEALCPVPGEVSLPGFDARLRARVLERRGPTPAPGPSRACLDADLMAGPLLVRPRRPGDRFTPLGGPGSRKVKAFLIDRKVPVDERGRIPLVLSRGKIAWVVGHQIDDRFKVTPRTRRILVLEKEPR
jgi:tRNA(Ile)-lysidine synthase